MKQLRQFLMLLTTLLVSQSAMAEYYGLKVGGVSVTSDNCSNITGEHIKPWLDGYISTEDTDARQHLHREERQRQPCHPQRELRRADHPLRQPLPTNGNERLAPAPQCQHHHHEHSDGYHQCVRLLGLLDIHRR